MAQIDRETYDESGNVSRDTIDVPQEQIVAQSLGDALDTAISYFAGNYQNWGTMTAAQKDAANRNAQRALARIARMLRQRFDATD